MRTHDDTLNPPVPRRIIRQVPYDRARRSASGRGYGYGHGHGRRFFHHDHRHRHAEDAEKQAGGDEQSGVMAWIRGLTNRF